jgi:hypothetical protein
MIMLENRASEGLFGPKTGGVTEEWRQFRSEELRNFALFAEYRYGDQISSYLL